MECTSSKTNEIVVIRVAGRLNAETVPDFEKECGRWINEEEKRIVVDFSRLEYISSAGLRSIMSIGKNLKTAGGVIAFGGLKGMVMEIFDIAGFTAIFPIYQSLEKALQEAGN